MGDFSPSKRVVMALHLCAVFAFSAVTVYHYQQPAEPIVHLILPPLLAAYFAITALLIALKPDLMPPIMKISPHLVIVAFAIGLYVPLADAMFFRGPPLVEAMPPVTALVPVAALSTFIFLSPDRASQFNLRVFLPFASPPAIYLLANPAELFTPRGIELFLAFGPLILATTTIAWFISDLWNKALQFRAEAEFDSLTGLFQRRAGMQRAEATLAAGTTLGVLFLDMDNLKPINDGLGHDAGDQALRNLAKVLKAVAKPKDIAIRWGDDEFVLAVSEADDVVLATCKRAIQDRLAAIDDLGTAVSIGATVAMAGEDMAALIQRADAKMYEAKLASKKGQ